jgi:hypothetical protein
MTLAAIACLGGCVTRPAASPVTAAVTDTVTGTRVATPSSPFDDAPVSFFISGLRFGAAQVATIQLCVTPDGQVTRASLLESSGDDRFDELAMIWARRVRLRKDDAAPAPLPGAAPPAGAAHTAGTPHEACGPVRVELHIRPKRALGGPSEAVG